MRDALTAAAVLATFHASDALVPQLFQGSGRRLGRNKRTPAGLRNGLQCGCVELRNDLFPLCVAHKARAIGDLAAALGTDATDMDADAALGSFFGHSSSLGPQVFTVRQQHDDLVGTTATIEKIQRCSQDTADVRATFAVVLRRQGVKKCGQRACIRREGRNFAHIAGESQQGSAIALQTLQKSAHFAFGARQTIGRQVLHQH